MTEYGNRVAFLDRARTFAARGTPENVAHPQPAAQNDPVSIAYLMLDDNDLVGSFERNATASLLNVHRSATVDVDYLRMLVKDNGIAMAVVSQEPVARAVGEQLHNLGVDVRPYDRHTAETADLGITAPFAAIAATGSLVQDSSLEGARGASLLPRLHLAVVPTGRIVATTADVLRAFGTQPMPANVVLITGPSRTGDIEMILTVGVHGPVAVHVCLVD